MSNIFSNKMTVFVLKALKKLPNKSTEYNVVTANHNHTSVFKSGLDDGQSSALVKSGIFISN